MRLHVVPRFENNHTDSLAKLGAATKFQLRRSILIKQIAHPSVQQQSGEILHLDASPEWRNPNITKLEDETLPYDKVETRKLQHLASKYTFLGDILYMKSYSSLHSNPYLRCLGPDEARRVIQEIHDDCRNHAGGHSLTHKVINHRYYWPKMFDDTKDYVKSTRNVKVCSGVKQTEYRPPQLTQLILHAMRIGRNWVASPSTIPVMIPPNSHRRLHQIGRGSITLLCHRVTDYQVFLVERSVQLRAPPHHYLRQWYELHQQESSEFCNKDKTTH